MSEPLNIYLDANAIIRFAESDDDQLEPFFIRTLATGARFFTSELSLAEVLVVPLRRQDDDLVRAYDRFLRTDEALTMVEVDRNVLRRSAELRASLGGHGMDAIHVATAAISCCQIIVSSDKGLRMPEGIERVAVDNVESIGLLS